MHDVPRPEAKPTLAERIAARVAFAGPGRLLTAGLSILLVAAGCWWLLRAPAPPVEAGLPYSAGAGATTSTTPSGGSSVAVPASSAPPAPVGTIVVQAAGAVVSPGVYPLPSGSRVHELIDAAGGPRPDADPGALALAAPLADGERVYVPVIGEVVPGPAAVGSGGTGGGAAGTSPVDLNRASADELDELPGIGPATAEAIVDHRDRNGPFLVVDDLLDVRGIGPAKLDAIRELVSV